MKDFFLVITITGMLLILCGFKYSFFSKQPFALKMMMPIGISFYTFKMIGYLVDIYRGEAPEYHLGKYALFVAFFPEISSGPIDRGNKLLAELSKKHIFDYDKTTYGLKLIAWGYFKKVIIADFLAGYVDRIWTSLYSYQGFVLILVSFFFTLQIYCDFSGYSDMAMGIARLLDIDIMMNFRSPYFADSFKEFWKRWHISLSTWLRDYIYIPWGGGTYIVWGILHGLMRSLEPYFCKKATGSRRMFRIAGVFLFCSIAWIFFRAESLEQVIYILRQSIYGIEHPIVYLKQGQVDLQFDLYMCIRVSFLMIILTIFDYMNQSRDVLEVIGRQVIWIRWTIYVLFAFVIFMFLPVKQAQEFIYFQF